MRRRTSATERNALISGERAKIIRPIIFNSQSRWRVFQRVEGVSAGAVCMLDPAREVPHIQLLKYVLCSENKRKPPQPAQPASGALSSRS